MLIGREMSSSKKFPGIYPMPSRRLETVPSPRTIPYLKELYDTKLDKQYEPNTVYVVDENGTQKNISIEELMGKGIEEWLKHDTPADGKQYTRQDHEWKEKISAIINKLICGDAGIGRQASLRCLCQYWRVGSSPISRTSVKDIRDFECPLFFCVKIRIARLQNRS